MTKLLIDTCVWLDIAKTTKGETILNLLATFIEQEEIKLLLPEIIVTEFVRNKERVIADAGKSLSSHFKKVKEIVAEYGNQDTKEAILLQLNNIDKRIPTLSDNAFNSVSHIEKLMKNAEMISITNDIILRAAQRAIDKKAPFYLSKNSIGDAIILEAFNEYKVQNAAQEFSFMFVTHNVNDFSLRNGNQKLPHEDLINIFDSNRSQYFVSLPEALTFINPDLVEESELENDWDFAFRSLSEILEIENELEQKIWYSRHKFRESQIKKGKIKLIDQKDFDIKTSHKTIVKGIWTEAVDSARKAEEKYGSEKLHFLILIGV